MQNATNTRTRLIRVSFLVFAMIAASAIATYAADRYILHTAVRLGWLFITCISIAFGGLVGFLLMHFLMPPNEKTLKSTAGR